MTDPIADMLTRVRNAVHARRQRVDVPASRFKAEVARILEQEGYIQSFKVLDDVERPQGLIRIVLKYGPRGENVITGLQRVSRPGRRVYLGRDNVPKVMGGLGTSILTTSRGVMTGREAIVKTTLENPGQIRASRSDAEVLLFYHADGSSRWVCAVAKRAAEQGFLITGLTPSRKVLRYGRSESVFRSRGPDAHGLVHRTIT